MEIQPIDTLPRPLWITPWGPWLAQRVAGWGTLPPSFSTRWQFCFGYWFSPCRSICSIILPPVYPFDLSAPREAQPGKPLDLLWPYEIPVLKEETVYDESTVLHPHYQPGSYLDLLT